MLSLAERAHLPPVVAGMGVAMVFAEVIEGPKRALWARAARRLTAMRGLFAWQL